MKARITIVVFLLFAGGCVGSPFHASLTHHDISSRMKRNNEALLKLQIGMTTDKVLEIMRKPERSEGYPWGSAWLYRTAMTKGIEGGLYGQIDADYTPLIFDREGLLQGWGRNYFEQYVNRYELTIKKEK